MGTNVQPKTRAKRRASDTGAILDAGCALLHASFSVEERAHETARVLRLKPMTLWAFGEMIRDEALRRNGGKPVTVTVTEKDGTQTEKVLVSAATSGPERRRDISRVQKRLKSALEKAGYKIADLCPQTEKTLKAKASQAKADATRNAKKASAGNEPTTGNAADVPSAEAPATSAPAPVKGVPTLATARSAADAINAFATAKPADVKGIPPADLESLAKSLRRAADLIQALAKRAAPAKRT